MCLKALLQLYVSYHHTEFSYQPKLTELSKMMLFLIMQQNTKMTDNSVIKKHQKMIGLLLTFGVLFSYNTSK